MADVYEETSKLKENAVGDDVDLTGINLDVPISSHRIQLTSDSESENHLIPETRSIMHGQDLGADDFLNFENNIKDYDWVLSPPQRVSPLEMDEHTTPLSNLENTRADCTSKTDVAPKLSKSFSNGVKSLNGNIRRPSPSRKAPSTTNSMRPSTLTSRATVISATKPLAPSKRSTTPTPRLSVLPVAKSASRSSTPTQRPSVIAAAKSASRSSTPTQRPSVTAAVKSASRSSTPTQRPSVTAAVKSASRSSTPIQRSSVPSVSKSTSRSSTPTQRPSINAAAKSASRSSTPTTRSSNPSGSLTTSVNGNKTSTAMKSRGSSPSAKPRPSKDPPENLEPPAVKLPVTAATNMKAVQKRTSCSPSRRLVSNSGGVNSVKSTITSGHAYSNGNDDEDVNPVLMGTKMVERVVNMRKLVPPRQEHIPNHNSTSGKLSVSQDNSGFGRSLSKKSFDMAMRHLDIRRSMPGNSRVMITKVPASSVYSVRPESTKTRTNSTSDALLTTSNNESGRSYD